MRHDRMMSRMHGRMIKHFLVSFVRPSLSNKAGHFRRIKILYSNSRIKIFILTLHNNRNLQSKLEYHENYRFQNFLMNQKYYTHERIVSKKKTDIATLVDIT